MKRTTLVSLAATLPIAALAIGNAVAQPPTAAATAFGASVPAKVSYIPPVIGPVRDYVIIIITTAWGRVVGDIPYASTGIKAASPSDAAKSLDG
ncbi:MAG: hypothetical protein ABSB70_01040 [Candidatus Velthaea sp.]